MIVNNGISIPLRSLHRMLSCKNVRFLYDWRSFIRWLKSYGMQYAIYISEDDFKSISKVRQKYVR